MVNKHFTMLFVLQKNKKLDKIIKGVQSMNEKNNKNKPKKEKNIIQILHPFVVIFGAVLFAMLLTFVVPLGRYEVKEVSYVLDGVQQSSKMVDANSFRYVLDEDGQKVVYPAPLFGVSAHKELGIMNVMFAGLRGSTQAAGTVGLIPFLLVIGGSFGILMRTGVIDQVILRVAKRTEDFVMLIPPILFFICSLSGALFGFTEYIIPITMIFIPMIIAMDFDAITGVICTYGAVQIGTAFSWTASSNLIMVQTLAGVPIESGQKFRVISWFVITVLCIIYVTIRAWKIHTGSEKAISYKNDSLLRGKIKNIRDRKMPYGVGSRLVMITVLMSFIWLIWGIAFKEYSLFEIASIFFTMAIVVGAIGTFYHLNGMQFADIPKAFQSGAADFLGAVIAIGMAQGMVLLLGGIDPTAASVLNTLLHWVVRVLSYVPSILAAWVMYGFQFVFNFFVPNNSGQAALTIPIMAPLAESLGVSRQISILAFQLGTGLSHLIMPTSGALIGVLAISHVSWGEWIRSQWKCILFIFIIGFIILGTGIMINYA